MGCLVFESMPLNPGTLNACKTCKQLEACLAHAGLTPRQAEEKRHRRELASRGPVSLPENEKAKRRTPPVKPKAATKEDRMSEKEMKDEKGKTKCSCGCGKLATFKGMSNSCFKKAHGMTVARAKDLEKKHGKAPEPTAAAAKSRPAARAKELDAFAKQDPAAAGVTGFLRIDITGWSLDKLVRLKALLDEA
jgi:hypothetical protein